MAPPFFSHNKKRKSRSRGCSARRKSRNKSKSSNLAASRSMSVDVTSSNIQSNSTNQEITDSIAGTSGITYDRINNYHQSKRDKSRNFKPSINKNLRPYEGLVVGLNEFEFCDLSIASLADKVATGAIAKAGSALKNNPSGATSKKKMVSEEEKLDNLCHLLDRLDTKYGSNSNSPSKSGSNASLNLKSETSTPTKQPKVKSSKSKESSLLGRVSQEVINNLSQVNQNIVPLSKDKNKEKNPKISNNSPIKLKGSNENEKSVKDENSLTQEEKKALRKSKKEAKKQGKQPAIEKKEIDTPVVEKKEVKPASHESIAKDAAETSEKSKADLKRERREKQEAQRAAKLQAKVVTAKKVEPEVKPKVIKKKEHVKPSVHTKLIPFLSHLMVKPLVLFPPDTENCYIHPAIRAVGLQIRDHLIDSCNARVVATLSAVCSLLEDYVTPPDREFSRDFADLLTYNFTFLNEMRPMLESMMNVLNYIKRAVNNIDNSIPEVNAKEIIESSIETYINQNIVLASKTIAKNVIDCIDDNEVILTFGGSLLVLDTIRSAAAERENITLIIADSIVPAAGLSMMKELADLDIKIYYRMLTDVHQVLNMATIVIVEAEAICLNGAMVAPCGVSGLAFEAYTKSIPVYVLSHTYKLCNSDLHNSLMWNELGDPNEILRGASVHPNPLGNDATSFPTNLNLINLTYDVTPPELIQTFITEREHFPTSCVPSIIKKNDGKFWYRD